MVAIILNDKKQKVLKLRQGEINFTNLQFCYVCKREIISDFYLCSKYKRVFCHDCGTTFYCEKWQKLPVFDGNGAIAVEIGLDLEHQHEHIDLIEKEWTK